MLIHSGTVGCINITAAEAAYTVLFHTYPNHRTIQTLNKYRKAIDDDNGLVYTQCLVTMHKNKKILLASLKGMHVK